jgi:hypothetical protein
MALLRSPTFELLGAFMAALPRGELVIGGE